MKLSSPCIMQGFQQQAKASKPGDATDIMGKAKTHSWQHYGLGWWTQHIFKSHVQETPFLGSLLWVFEHHQKIMSDNVLKKMTQSATLEVNVGNSKQEQMIEAQIGQVGRDGLISTMELSSSCPLICWVLPSRASLATHPT